MMRRGERPDALLLLSVAVILGIGLLTVYSSSRALDSGDVFVRQLVWVVAGLLAMWAGYSVSGRVVDEMAGFAWAAVCLLLILTIPLGSGPAGRWLSLGPIRVQPSEPAKAVLILIVAKRLVESRRRQTRARELGVLAFALPLVALTWLQPDLGTAALMCLLTIAMFMWAGYGPEWLYLLLSPLLAALSSMHILLWVGFTLLLVVVLARKRLGFGRWLLFLGGNSAIAAVTPTIWNLLRPYQQQRLITFINPAADPQGAGWNIIQSQVAVGSGGVTGQGFLQGAQKGLAFLPARHTDFVFSVWAEETGLLGCMLLLGAFWVLVWRLVIIARRSVSPFSSLMVAGVAAYFSLHLFINVGMALGLMPVTGLPLTLVSYGGSSMVTSLFLLGLALRAGVSWRVI
mgnify:CR=1 FL=1